MPQPPADATWSALWRSGLAGRFGLLCLGIWLHAADELIIATIVPAVVNDIGGLNLVGWTFALYETGAIAAGATTGWLIGRSAPKPVMIGAAALFMTGCLISGLAPTMPIMLVGRALQGLGGGGLIAVAFVATEIYFPRNLWPKLFAIMSVVWGSSAFLGPLIGGLFAEFGLWRWSFFAFAIQAALLIVVIAVALPAEPDRKPPVASSGLPVIRLLLLTGAIVMIAAAGIDVDPATSPLLILAGVVAFLLFLKRDAASGPNRLLPSRPLDPRHPLGAGLLAVLLMTTATVSYAVYAATLMKTLHGISLIAAGYIIALESIGWSLASISVASLPQRFERSFIRAGMLCVVTGLAGAMLTMATGPFLVLLVWPFLLGAGFGMSWPFIIRHVVEAAPDAQSSIAASAAPTLQRAGYAIGASYAGIIANWSGFEDGLTTETATAVAFWLFAASLLLALPGLIAVLAMTSPRTGVSPGGPDNPKA